MTTNLWKPFQIQLDSTGSGSLEVGSPSLGYNWQAFSTVNPAPAGQTQVVSVSGQVVAQGGRQTGPFAAGSGQEVTVAISGGPAGGSVAGVLQGSIQEGMAAQATLPGSGSLIEISGGVIDVSGSDVVISGGQGGNVNVSTDAPPVAGPTLEVAAGASSASYTLHPPSNATAIGFALVPIPTYTLQVAIQDALTLVELFNFIFPAAGAGVVGRSITLPLTPGMTESGIVVTATAGGTLAAAANFAFTLWYLGTNSMQPVNLPAQPLYVQGQGAEGIAGSSNYPGAADIDQIVQGLGAADYNSGSQAAVPVDMLVQGLNAAGMQGVGAHTTAVDQVVRGNQGSTLLSVQTRPEAPQNVYTLGEVISANTVLDLFAPSAGTATRLRKILVMITPPSTASAEMDLQTSSTAGTGVIAKFYAPAGNPLHISWDMEGYSLGVNVNLYAAIYATANSTFIISLTYDEY